jgi:predicted HicB family RNase H-like nuclease
MNESGPIRTSYRSRSEEPATEQPQIQFRITSALRDRLHAEAERRTVSVNYLIERAVEESLTKWEKQRLP